MVRAATAEVEVIASGGSKVKREVDKAERGLSSLGKSVSGFSLASVTGFSIAGVAMGAFVTDATKRAMEFSATMRGFTNLVEGDVNSFLNELSRAAGGTINKLELTRTTNQAILLGIAQEDLPKLLEASRKIGAAVGRTTTEAFADITTGMARQSRLILDNLGIIIDAEQAYEDYANSIGKSTSELTQLEKQIAFNNAAADAAFQKAESLGDVIDEQSEAIQRASARWDDFTIQLGTATKVGLGSAILAFEDLGRAVLDTDSKVGEFIRNLPGTGGTTLDIALRAKEAQAPMPMEEGIKNLVNLLENRVGKGLDDANKHLQDISASNQSIEDVAKSSGRFIGGQQVPLTAEEFEQAKNQARRSAANSA